MSTAVYPRDAERFIWSDWSQLRWIDPHAAGDWNESEHPRSSDGKFGDKGERTHVGITSSGTQDRAQPHQKDVERSMRVFADKLKDLPGVSDVSVVKGTGVFFGVAEPTWVTAYTGNGEARKLLAATGDQFNQDAVLIMRAGNTDAAVDLMFDQKISTDRRDSIHGMMKERGIAGGTWFLDNDGRSVLRMASVKTWGGLSCDEHIAATKDLAAHLARIGTRNRAETHDIETEVIARKDYAQVLKGLQDGQYHAGRTGQTQGTGSDLSTDGRGRSVGQDSIRRIRRSAVRTTAEITGSGRRNDDSNRQEVATEVGSKPTSLLHRIRALIARFRAAVFNPEQPRDPSGKWTSGDFILSPVTSSLAFRSWFGASKVVDTDGSPLVVYHGTTHDIAQFAEAGDPRLNAESDFGAGIYFTNEPEDLSANYAGVGPDMTSRIEQRADQLDSEHDREWADHATSVAEATKELAGGGAVSMPVYLSMQNPFVLGSNEEVSNVKETYLTSEYGYEDPEDPESDMTEPTGTLIDFTNALRDVAHDYYETEGVYEFISDVMEQGMDGGLSASELDTLWRKNEKLAYVTDENGQLMGSELYRKALQTAGFDGVIDHTVDSKFGSARRIGQSMAGMNPNTTHYIAFTPTQIKSSIGNRKFDPKNPVITLSDFRAADKDAGGHGSYKRNEHPDVTRTYNKSHGVPDLVGRTANWTPSTGGRLFTGTTVEFFPQLSSQPTVYLTDDFKEAGGYAEGLHDMGGGHRGSPVSRTIEAAPGKTVDISAAIVSAMDDDSFEESSLVAMFDSARKSGARYVVYDHPAFYRDPEQHVIVSLYPSEDLNLLKGKSLADFDEVSASELKAAKAHRPETEVHAAADLHAPVIAKTVRAAFDVAKQSINRPMLDRAIRSKDQQLADLAVSAVPGVLRLTLARTLIPVLRDVFNAGGHAGAKILAGQLASGAARAAGRPDGRLDPPDASGGPVGEEFRTSGSLDQPRDDAGRDGVK